jgi:hypothetical protein
MNAWASTDNARTSCPQFQESHTIRGIAAAKSKAFIQTLFDDAPLK